MAVWWLSIRWTERNIYASACNVVSTREEVVLFFGINQGMRGGGEEIVVERSRYAAAFSTPPPSQPSSARGEGVRLSGFEAPLLS